jgi:hypothetical protein
MWLNMVVLQPTPYCNFPRNRTVVITSVLPVSGLQFGAAKNNNKADLKWSTVSETNTLHFDVLHSIDGISFVKLTTVASAQNSTSLQTYSFTHTAPVNGANYYKLKLADIDGRSTFSDVKQLHFGKANFTIVPNPVAAGFTVSNPFAGSAILV